MDKPISVGDLVVVVRHCCNLHIGKISHVHSLSTIRSQGHEFLACYQCGSRVTEDLPVAELNFGQGAGWMLLKELKRIPPLEELEREKLLQKLPEIVL